MMVRRVALWTVFWAFLGTHLMGQPTPVRDLVQRADPHANIEYGGAVSAGAIDYYLFLLERKELAGVALVKQRPGAVPVIVDVDTSLFPFRDDSEQAVERPVQEAIEMLLRKRNLVKNGPAAARRNSRRDPEVSEVGREIDLVTYPICGFRLGTNSTREILRLLRTGSAVEVDPGTAPPGSIIVSPTQSSPHGPIYLGHAGIVGTDGSIYSADARYGGKRSKNYSLTSWLRQFSGTNGSYAFVLHAPTANNVHGIRAPSQ
jgi:hypothetical protein